MTRSQTKDAGTPTLTVDSLWKVFGPKSAQVPASSELRELTRRELLDRAGCTAPIK